MAQTILVDPAALVERTGLAYRVQAEQQSLALRVEAAEKLPSIMTASDTGGGILQMICPLCLIAATGPASHASARMIIRPVRAWRSPKLLSRLTMA
jgi:hypothetical protein